MNGPERLAKAREHIANVKGHFEMGRDHPEMAPIKLSDAGIELCELIEWIVDMIEADADDQGV